MATSSCVLPAPKMQFATVTGNCHAFKNCRCGDVKALRKEASALANRCLRSDDRGSPKKADTTDGNVTVRSPKKITKCLVFGCVQDVVQSDFA
jgi:hypothetical protein